MNRLSVPITTEPPLPRRPPSNACSQCKYFEADPNIPRCTAAAKIDEAAYIRGRHDLCNGGRWFEEAGFPKKLANFAVTYSDRLVWVAVAFMFLYLYLT